MSDDYISMKCANCGGSLDVYSDMQRLVCGFCGSEMLVKRRGGTISLNSIR